MRKTFKYHIILLLLIACSNGILFGQEMTIVKDGVKKEIYYDRSHACNEEMVLSVAPQMPQYNGGLEQLEFDLNDAIFIDKKVKEGIYLRCTVNCNGEIFGFLVDGENNSDLKEKIINELLKLQNWQPAEHRGNKVDCFYGLGLRIKKGKIILSR